MHLAKAISYCISKSFGYCGRATSVSNFSTTSSLLHNVKTYKKKWYTTKDWKKVKSGEDEIPWLHSIPDKMNKDKWTKEEAYLGMYDYLPILGNDVTIRNRFFCDGPDYVRAYSGNELRRLLRKKQELGHRMHAEDLHTVEKHIKYLMCVENQRRKKTHG